MATTVCILAVPFGMALGYSLPFLHMSASSPLQGDKIESRKDQLSNISLVWAIVHSILLIACAIPHFKGAAAGKK